MAEFIPHPCAWCHEDMERMPGEAPYFYNKRKTCDPSTGKDCRHKWKRECAQVRQKRPMPDLKKCPSCGGIIPYKDDTPSQYAERTICRRKDNPVCFQISSQTRVMSAAKARRKKPTASEDVQETVIASPEPPKSRQSKILQREAEKLDAAQRELDRKTMEKYLNDYTTFPGKSLDEQTRRELEKVYQPPMVKNYDIMPHFHGRARGII